MSRRRQKPSDPEEVRVASLSHDGRGVARPDGKAVFVHGALPDERVRIRRTHRRRDYDQAELLEVLESSPDRVEPPCPYFGTCGGCALQHLAPDRQIEAKQSTLEQNLQRIGRVTPERMLPPLRGPEWHYRRRARLGVRYVPRKGRVLVGFRERGKSFITDMRYCHVLEERAAALIEPLSELIHSLTIVDRVPQIEVAGSDDRLALVFRVLMEPRETDIEKLQAFERAHGIDLYLQPGGLDTVRPLSGEAAELSYTLPPDEVRLHFRPTDFIQVNAEINRSMVRQVFELMEPGAEDSVLDLFCGLGNFSLPLANRVARVVGVEGDRELVRRASENARANDLGNAAFHVADLFGELDREPWWKSGFDRVLLDPPRSGAREVLPFLPGTGASRIVYVSCNPATLARDAGVLVNELGYRLSCAGVMDMFPHTGHVESIALFEKQ